MTIRICINCKITYTKGVSGFDTVFSREDHHWCSRRCMWLWLAEHDVKVNGEPILDIIFGRPKKEMHFTDCLKTDEIIRHAHYFLIS